MTTNALSPLIIKTANIKHLVLSGGGLLGISYIGLFKYLEEHNAISQISTITGCSAGAIFGTLLAIGYTSVELNSIIKSLNFKDYLNITADSIINFIKLKGFDSGKNIMDFIKKSIKDKTDNENITFNQVYEKYNIKLKIGVSNLTSSKFELFDNNKTPNLPIYQAINASIAIPFIFEPVIINKQVYCDGGLLDNLPIEYMLNLETTNNTNTDGNTHVDELDTLGIYLMNKFATMTCDNYQTITLSHYLYTLSYAYINESIYRKINNENIKINKKYKIIVFEIPCDIMTFIKISATHEDIDNIINIAYTTTKNNLDNTTKINNTTKIDTLDNQSKIDTLDNQSKIDTLDTLDNQTNLNKII